MTVRVHARTRKTMAPGYASYLGHTEFREHVSGHAVSCSYHLPSITLSASICPCGLLSLSGDLLKGKWGRSRRSRGLPFLLWGLERSLLSPPLATFGEACTLTLS